MFLPQLYKPASIVFLLLTLLSGCGTKDKPAQAPSGMHVLSLKEFGKPFTLFVPDTNKFELSVGESPDGALVISSGKRFHLAVYEQQTDLEMKKRDISEDEVNRLVRIYKELPDAILWESAITVPEFHFVVNRTFGDRAYSFTDLPGVTYDEAAVNAMFESASNATAE